MSTPLESLNQIMSMMPPTHPVALEIQECHEGLTQAVEGVYSNLAEPHLGLVNDEGDAEEEE